jgi:class 3 adenylate cyclase/tetratricopeptide (TPR) repeat protein
MLTFFDWLKTAGLEQYTSVFVENEIDFDALRLLSDNDLQDLGLSLGSRRKLLNAIAQLNGAASSTFYIQDRAHSAKPAESSRTSGEGERRQLTVLFCDLVGFTELANRVDPELLQRIIRSYEDTCALCISRYEGHIFQRLGDGIVAFFGYPHAHEDEAERAIRSALKIIDSLSNLDVPDVGHLAVRIGIATGVVVVSPGEKGAVGDTMNLAARLQGIAQPGSIVVSERVHRLAAGSFDFEGLSEQTLKGIEHPIRAYRILEVSQAASRFDAATQEELTPLVGREQEIGLLLERWALAQNGEGQVVLLSGEPGIGKSRMLSELRGRLESQGAQTLRFQCSPYHVNSAFWPSIDNIERALRFGRDETPESKLDKLEELIVTHYGRPLNDVRFIAEILSLPFEARYGALTLTPQKHKDETLRALVDMAEAAARKQLSVMLFEDVHWSDPTTLEVLDLLIDRVRTIPLLIVLTHRPEFQPEWTGHGHLMALNLSKLTRAQGTAMVYRLTGGKALPPDLLEQIVSKADGVPLFAEELTKSILESGELKDAGDHYDYAGSARSITIPATLRDSLMARLDRFTPVKEIAQIGAAIGREFSYELIAAVAPHVKAELNRALKQLTESGLAFRRGTPPEASYVFKHALVQDAAYDSLLKSRRHTLHARIAQVIDQQFPTTKDTAPELLAYHLTAAGEAEAAIPFWQKAGTLAIQRLALKEAISHLNRGMEIIGTLPQSVERDGKELDLRTPLGTAWMALKGWTAPEVWASFHPALGLAKSLGRHEALVPIYYGLWASVITQGQLAQALAWVNEMLATAKASGDLDLLIVGHSAACTTYYWRGEFISSREHADRVLALYSEEKHHHLADIMNVDPKTYVGLYASLGTWMLGYPDRAVQESDAKDTNARRRNHPFDMGYALTIGALLWDFRCEPERLLTCAEAAERLGRAHSLPFVSEVLAQLFKGLAWLRGGRLEEGIPQLRNATESWTAGGASAVVPLLRATLAEGIAHNGDLDGGLSLIEESLAQIAQPGWEERSHLAEVLRLKAWMLQQQGKLAAAEENYLASLNVGHEQQAKSWELRTSTSLARLWQAQGKLKAAYDMLAPVYEWFTEGLDTHDLKQAKTLLDELSAQPVISEGAPREKQA